MRSNLNCAILAWFFCVLLLDFAKAQRSTSDSGPLTNTNNGQQLPIPYQQPYLGYFQGYPQQPLPYIGHYQQYSLPGGNVQSYYPVLYHNVPKRDDHHIDHRGGGQPREFYPGAEGHGANSGGHGPNNGGHGPNNGGHGANHGGHEVNNGGYGVNNFMGAGNDPYPHIKAEIIDVDPEYQRQLLGPIIEDAGGPHPQNEGVGVDHHRHHHHRRPVQYIVKTSGSTTNYTNIPQQMNKPVITRNSYSTTIRRTFVNDPSQPQKPINLHFVNGVQVNTEAPVNDEGDDATETTTVVEDVETTTENENPQANNTSFQGRRFLDVPKTCPSGSKIAHNGQCLETFQLALPLDFGNQNSEATTTVVTTPVADGENE